MNKRKKPGKKLTAIALAEKIALRMSEATAEEFLVAFYHESFMKGIEHEQRRISNTVKHVRTLHDS